MASPGYSPGPVPQTLAGLHLGGVYSLECLCTVTQNLWPEKQCPPTTSPALSA